MLPTDRRVDEMTSQEFFQFCFLWLHQFYCYLWKACAFTQRMRMWGWLYGVRWFNSAHHPQWDLKVWGRLYQQASYTGWYLFCRWFLCMYLVTLGDFNSMNLFSASWTSLSGWCSWYPTNRSYYGWITCVKTHLSLFWTRFPSSFICWFLAFVFLERQ